MSFAQFRPEKNQIMQISIFHEVCKNLVAAGVKEHPRFFMVGSVRGPDDEKLLKDVQDKAEELGLKVVVFFI